MADIMRAHDEEMRRDRAEQSAGLASAMAVVQSLVSQRKLEHIQEYIADCGNCRDFEITESHGGEREDCEGYAFRYVYLVQRGGHLGDDFDGEIWIPLPKGKFLKFHFAC